MQYAGKVFCVLTHPHCYFLLVPVVRHLPVPHPFFSCTTEALRIPPAFHLSCHVQTWWNYWRVLECHLGASWRLLEETPGFRSYDRFYSCKIQEKKFLNLSVLLGSLSSITLREGLKNIDGQRFQLRKKSLESNPDFCDTDAVLPPTELPS